MKASEMIRKVHNHRAFYYEFEGEIYLVFQVKYRACTHEEKEVYREFCKTFDFIREKQPETHEICRLHKEHEIIYDFMKNLKKIDSITAMEKEKCGYKHMDELIESLEEKEIEDLDKQISYFNEAEKYFEQIVVIKQKGTEGVK